MNKPIDGQWHHPFTCLVSGASGSGKSTFVRSLILSQKKIIDVEFDYIIIVIGTAASENTLLSSLLRDIPPSRTAVKLIELNKRYSTKKEMVEKFPVQLRHFVEDRNSKKEKGCVIFDDLMKELGEMGILLNLFTKMSSHYGLSVIQITQNLFHKGGGKHASDHVSVYRNAHITVLFHNPLDKQPFWTVASRLMRKGSARLANMLEEIAEKHRYVVIHGGMNWPKELRFMSDLFGETGGGIHRQRVFQLEEGTGVNYAEGNDVL